MNEQKKIKQSIPKNSSSKLNETNVSLKEKFSLKNMEKFPTLKY